MIASKVADPGKPHDRRGSMQKPVALSPLKDMFQITTNEIKYVTNKQEK